MLYGTAIGNLGRDAELKNVNGRAVLNFSVATTYGYGDNQQTNWVGCALWGERATKLAPYMLKGTPVVALGAVYKEEYNGKTYDKMNVDEVQLQGRREQQQPQSQGQQYAPPQQHAPAHGYHQPAPAPMQQATYQTQQPQPQQGAPAGGFDDDIPF